MKAKTDKITGKNKKGLSEVVSIVLILALTVALVGIVWGVISNLIEEGVSEGNSCFDIFGKVTLNNDYTCYNSTSNEMLFGINVGDIVLDEVIVAIAANGTSLSFRISNQTSQVANLMNYPDRSTNIVLPAKGGGKTYILSLASAGLSGPASSIRVAPIVANNQCEITDSLEQIDDCASLIP